MQKAPQVVEHCHQCLQWLIPALDKFPRNRRFTLGEKMESALLDVLALTTEAGFAKNKQPSLQSANKKIAIVQHLWRLSFELKIVDKRRYLHCAEMLVNIGRQIGGWLKKLGA